MPKSRKRPSARAKQRAQRRETATAAAAARPAARRAVRVTTLAASMPLPRADVGRAARTASTSRTGCSVGPGEGAAVRAAALRVMPRGLPGASAEDAR